MSTIKVDAIKTRAGNVPKAGDLGLNITGTVLQVVEGSHSSQVATTSTSFADTALAVSITPIATSSKVLLIMNANMYHGTGGAQAFVTLFRGNSSGTNLGNGTAGFGAAHNA